MRRVLTFGLLVALSALAVLGAWIAFGESPAAPAGPVQPAPSTPPRPVRPETIKAIYLTSWSAATPERLARSLDLIDTTELNGIVIDVKDYSGKVVFSTGSPLVARMGSEVRRLGDLAALIRRFHDRGIYVTVRIAAFQDDHLAAVRPDLAVRNAAGGVWRDRQGLRWVDPASHEVWEYLVAVARAAAEAGVDELNFDYVRFPSDGALDGLQYPVFDEQHALRRQVIQQFFEYLTAALRPTGAVLSVDLFGEVTVAAHDLGIGQVLEDALLYFDYVSPMVYPSHYARGFLRFTSPAAHPYEVVHYSLVQAEDRRGRFAGMVSAFTASAGEQGTARPALARLRPWLQAFNLGAPYPPSVIREEIRAVYDAGLEQGWYLWSSTNLYDGRTFDER